MTNPKGMRATRIDTASGSAIHIYSNAEKIILQLRHSIPTEQDILTPSFKVAVELSDDEILALAGELLSVVTIRKKAAKKE
jgi:hypothetical protein